MNKLVIGLTGGIGSGKSTVANLFRAKGIQVIDADKCSRIVVEVGTPALQKIAEHFGTTILQADGGLDRPKLRRIIFESPAEKTWLEQLLHPLILQEIVKQLDHATSAYAILESPLLIEAGQRSLCHRVLVVDVTQEQQIQRTMQRDNNSRELVMSILKSQATREQRRAAAHDIIDNTHETATLPMQVSLLHEQYLQLAHQYQTAPTSPSQ